MVAAPEIAAQAQAQAAAAQTQVPKAGKAAMVNGAEGAEGQNGETTAVNGAGADRVDGLTVVSDSASAASPAQEAGVADGSHASLPPPSIARQIPCKFFPVGACRYGDSCAFAHVMPANGEVAVDPRQAMSPVLGPVDYSSPQRGPPMQLYSEGQQSMGMQGQVLHGSAPEGYPSYMGQMPMQPGYYPFPPPGFQQYPPGMYQGMPMPQPFYPPPPPQQAIPDERTSPSSPPTLPLSPEQGPMSPPPTTTTFTSPTQPPYVPYVPQSFGPSADYSYAPAPQGQQPPSETPVSPTNANFSPESQHASFPRQGNPAYLHTYFQTNGAGMPVPVPVANGSVPRAPAAARGAHRNSFSAGRPAFVPGKKGKYEGSRTFDPSRSTWGPRPPCTFFEACRCRHGDGCNFPHLLPDGTDARTLGRGMIGADGRSDNPEPSGGFPVPALHKAGLPFKGFNRSMNGGFPVKGPGPAAARRKFEESVEPRGREAAAPAAEAPEDASAAPAAPAPAAPASVAAAAPAPAAPAAAVAAPVPTAPKPRAQSEQRPPSMGSKSAHLVQAINGLTRKVAPSVNGKGKGGNAQTAAQTTAPVNNQKVPSSADFPSLPAPTSPPLSKVRSTSPFATESSRAETREPSPLRQPMSAVVAAPAPTPSPVPAPKPVEVEAPAPVAAAVAPAAEVAAPAPAPEATSEAAPAATEDAPVPAAAPAKLVGSFASAAARGAAAPTPVVPPPARRAPAVKKDDESEDKTGDKKKKAPAAKRDMPKQIPAAQQISLKA